MEWQTARDVPDNNMEWRQQQHPNDVTSNGQWPAAADNILQGSIDTLPSTSQLPTSPDLLSSSQDQAYPMMASASLPFGLYPNGPLTAYSDNPGSARSSWGGTYDSYFPVSFDSSASQSYIPTRTSPGAVAAGVPGTLNIQPAQFVEHWGLATPLSSPGEYGLPLNRSRTLSLDSVPEQSTGNDKSVREQEGSSQVDDSSMSRKVRARRRNAINQKAFRDREKARKSEEARKLGELPDTISKQHQLLETLENSLRLVRKDVQALATEVASLRRTLKDRHSNGVSV